jgi:adenine-specific DNA-methyltransferase
MSKLAELTAKLREVLQIDRPDLDFGIYRIMNARSSEITEYLTTRLPDRVKAALAEGGQASLEGLERELETAVTAAQAAGFDPETSPRVKELRQQIASVAGGAVDYENTVYSHLLTFFSRYYDQGDFISQRRYKGDTYAIPYAGEEVVLHWANKDQYYTKSGEAFSNYSFRLDDGRLVHCRLVSADTAKDNRKDNDRERRFVLIDRTIVTRLDEDGEAFEDVLEPVAEENGELVLRFAYRPMPKGTKQAELIAAGVLRVLEDDTVKARWQNLTRRAPTDKAPQRTLLEKHLTEYTTRNTADYFIHKDLGGFLRRELDFYIKNEVMNLDDVQNAGAFQAIQTQLRVIQTLRAIALDLIAFLAQLEDFQKKLWLKKKFVIAAQYCLTLDRVPEKLWKEVACNPAQWAQWRNLNVWTGEDGSVEDFGTRPALMIDTALYNTDFRSKILQEIPDLDGMLDGVLVHADNFQALRLLSARYEGAVQCTYIDPPYNTDASSINYKNGYKSSSWSTLIDGRIAQSMPYLTDNGVLVAAIDDVQYTELKYIVSENCGGNLLGVMVVRANPSGRPMQTGYAVSHEYLIMAGRTPASVLRRLPPTESQRARFNQNDSQGPFEWRNLRREGSDSNREDRTRMYYPVFVSSDGVRIPRMDWDGVQEVWHLQEAPRLGEAVVYPDNEDGKQKRWRWEADAVAKSTEVVARSDRTGKLYPYIKRRPHDDGVVAVSSWIDAKYSATEHGTAVVKDLFGDSVFSFPKSLHAVKDAIYVGGASKRESLVLDYFAGSGTTGHAAIALNRDDEGGRRYILVEQGEYFETVLKPRIQKVVYSAQWKDGRPTAPQTGISHAFKVLKIESYEDALNNLVLSRSGEQGSFLEAMPIAAREDYLLRYMLDVEARGSLLAVADFRKPFDYRLKVAVDSAGAAEERPVDLIETFNYLIGLTVRTSDLHLERGFAIVKGVLPDGQSALILWRDCEVLDYEGLLKLCEKLAINPADNEHHVVYVNGDHTIPTVATPDDSQGGETKVMKLRQIEPAFLDAMFASDEA